MDENTKQDIVRNKKVKKLARKYFKWWTHHLGLRYGSLSMCFVDYISNSKAGLKYINPDQVGSCSTDWRYQETDITLAVNKLSELSKEDIEITIVHELMHVFLNEMREEGIDHEERVATNLQKAFMWVRNESRKE